MTNIVSGQSITFGLTYDPDANGNPTTTLPGPVTWTISDATKANVVPATDGLTAVVTGTTVGDFVLSVSSGTLTDSIQCSTVGGVTTGIHIVQIPT